jgi:hypothetical protein
MSVSPTLPTFVNGQQGSASQIMKAFTALHSNGQTNLDNITNIYTESLVAFERRVSYLNSKQQQANKITNQNSLANFSITDFSSIDQSETTGTIHIDTNVVNCSEQNIEVKAVLKSIDFSTSVGSIETLDVISNVYRVYNTNSQTPTGTFSITLTKPINLSVLVFDLPSIAGNPIINVTVSDTGVIYNPCISYSLNGYRLIVYLNPAEITYIKLDITPSMPDNLGGSLYTFGVTDFVGNSTLYRLLSEFVSLPLTFTPTSLNCEISAIPTDGLLYFLSFNGGNYVEYSLGQVIPLAGVTAVAVAAATLNSSGLLSSSITSSTYLQSLQVIDNSTGLVVPIVFGITSSNPYFANLTKSYISIVGTSLYYIPYSSGDSAKTFKINYIQGPASMTAQLKVQLSTNDNNISPIFNGAVLLPA